MSARYQVLQHEQKPYWLPDCPLLMPSHALTKDTTNDTVFLQCKFENLSDKRIKAFTIHVECYDVTNQPLAAVDSFTYLDINVANAKTFGDQTPVPLPDHETRAFHIIPQKIVFTDNSIWENGDSQPFVLAEYEQKRISSLGDLADQYKRDLHDICSKASTHTYLPARKDGFTICGCGKIMLDNTKTCPACGVSIDALFALNNEEKLTQENKSYKQNQYERKQQEAKQFIIHQEELQQKKHRFRIITYTCIASAIVIGCAIPIGIHLHTAAVKKHFQEAFELAQEKKSVIDVGTDYTVGLKKDGTVIAFGSNNHFGECNVSDWTDIVAVSVVPTVQNDYTVGLKSNGTVVATGDNYYGQCNVQNWSDMVAISAGGEFEGTITGGIREGLDTIGLKSDGTVVAVGSNTHGKCDVNDFYDITAISAGGQHTVALKKDGTVIAIGYIGSNRCDVSEWNNIVDISAGHAHTIGLRKDGTVIAAGENLDGQCDVEAWSGIVAISAGHGYTVGLKADGTVVATGYNKYGQCDVQDWSDIVAIAAGKYHTVGVKRDGTLVAAGNNDCGQCNVDGIKLW